MAHRLPSGRARSHGLPATGSIAGVGVSVTDKYIPGCSISPGLAMSILGQHRARRVLQSVADARDRGLEVLARQRHRREGRLAPGRTRGASVSGIHIWMRTRLKSMRMTMAALCALWLGTGMNAPGIDVARGHGAGEGRADARIGEQRAPPDRAAPAPPRDARARCPDCPGSQGPAPSWRPSACARTRAARHRPGHDRGSDPRAAPALRARRSVRRPCTLSPLSTVMVLR